MRLEIVNWAELQPRHKGRTFPWIRQYERDLHDLSMRRLEPQTRDLLRDLQLLANVHANSIPDDPEYLREYLRLSPHSDVAEMIQTLVGAGFVCRQRAGKKAAGGRTRGRQAAGTGEVRGGEVRGDKSAATPQSLAQPDQARPAAVIRLGDGTAFNLSNAMLDELANDFPSVNLLLEIEAFSKHAAGHNPPARETVTSSLRGWLKNARPKAASVLPGNILPIRRIA